MARIVAAGGTSRIAGHRPDGGLYKTAELPAGTLAELVTDLEREGWHIVRVASTDPTAWVGEAEDELPPVPDYGDESEHDAWLAGTPAAELWPARPPRHHPAVAAASATSQNASATVAGDITRHETHI